ncbi:hypothetical protein [Staphylococcus intermedius]|nr:hypothetical protein [Staphylococcus intermedius]
MTQVKNKLIVQMPQLFTFRARLNIVHHRSAHEHHSHFVYFCFLYA